MRDSKIFKVIDNTEETKAFNPIKSNKTSPTVKQMTKFVHFNLLSKKDVLKGFSKFSPEDLR